MQGGQGDVLMAANGLQALLELGLPVLAPDATCFTRTAIVPLIRVMLPGIKVAPLAESQHAVRPRYATSAKTSWTTVFRNYFTSDWYVNFAERRRIASFGHAAPSRHSRIQQWLTDRKLAPGPRWLRETPSYYGLKMWAPMAEAWSVSEIALLKGLYKSHRTMATRLRLHAESFGAEPSLAVAIFPGGRSFQFVPPDFLKVVIDQLAISADQYCCYFAPDDPFIQDYKAIGLTCAITRSIEAMLAIMVRARIVATADSLASHVAQLSAKVHVALMSHDVPQHTIHPAAASVVVYEPLECCPCAYANRTRGSRCPAGHDRCAVFQSCDYREATLQALR